MAELVPGVGRAGFSFELDGWCSMARLESPATKRLKMLDMFSFCCSEALAL